MKKPDITEGEWEYTITKRTKNKLDILISKKDSERGSDWIAWVYERNNKDIANAEAICAVPEMIGALIDARNAIHSLPRESLGVGGDSGETRWAIRDELIYSIEQALKKAGVQF